MMKIKHKIAIPFMTMIVLLPLITLLAFNIIFNAYVSKNSKNELISAMETTNRLIKQQINDEITDKDSENAILSTIPKLSGIFKTSELATNTEIVIYSRQGKLLYPKNIQQNSILDGNVLSALRDFNFENKQIQKLKVDNKEFLVARSAAKQTNFKLIYVLSLDSAMKLIKVINLILIGIMAAATLITLTIVMIVAGSISKPIKEISFSAKKIGRGQFINIKPNKTSEEMDELYENINNMSNSLQQAENAQRAFLQNASHELRTPLMSIQGYAEGIMNGVFSDNCSAAKIISDESKRLTKLVEQLLILSRIENKTYKLNISKVNLHDLMKDYIQRINGLALKHQKIIKYEPSNEELTINIDDELLSQAVMNIASNGIRHAKSMIEIAVNSKLGFAHIVIKDDGDGISQEDLPHIFDRFYKGRDGNTGLGLSIAKSAIDFLGGELKAQNWDEGAEFIIDIPVKSQ